MKTPDEDLAPGGRGRAPPARAAPDSFDVDPAPYRACRLCPRNCGVDRTAGQRGMCGETAVCRMAAAELHRGEEPSFSGRRGSGTIFFSGCSCRCFFCQNHQISTGGLGEATPPGALLAAARRLIEAGAHNLNFVTPDPFWPHIEALALRLRAEGAGTPLLFNGSGYHRPELIPRMAEAIDIFLPDFKFADPGLAHSVIGDARYPEIACRAIEAMIEVRGFLDPWDPTGAETARQGVLVRHLVLPGEVANSLAALDLLRERFGRFLPLSVMRQFRPTPRCREQGRFTREVTGAEYAQVCARVEELGFEQVYLQDAPGEEAPFLPDFGRDTPFTGNARTPDDTGSRSHRPRAGGEGR